MAKQEIETMVVKPKIVLKYEDKDYSILDKDVEDTLESKINNISKFMNENSAKGKSDADKDKAYGDAQVIWNDFKATLDESKFNFYLDREQFDYLMNLLRNKFEYDVNAVFFVLEIANLLGDIETQGKKGFKEDKYIPFKLTATDVTYLYHILSQYKVKGLNRGTVVFASVIRRIGEISKLFDYYNNITKELSKDIVDWVAGFDDVNALPEAETKSKKKAEKTA